MALPRHPRGGASPRQRIFKALLAGCVVGIAVVPFRLRTVGPQIGDTFAFPDAAATRRALILGPAAAAASTLVAREESAEAATSVMKPPWAGKYTDPQHPGCPREIERQGKLVSITGYDAVPGPACGESASFSDLKSMLKAAPVSEFDIKGQVKFNSDAKQEQLLIDFSSKGGPKNVLGVWDGDGIKFPDGNKWTKTK
eukprot:CAMPEP_0115218072 /NCGR_PEP_ID=MMETSP0270-20121206/26193_1 /TAXON_ID=71861 /ORGANISM="Scrippsiella trochoidea, Strain CCMP3099" /LENGTH=197 /DNA_ID=CAMNT_0002631985 /DNA_START=31 /DNA_END=624 /DNA_ORIENTATION=-